MNLIVASGRAYGFSPQSASSITVAEVVRK